MGSNKASSEGINNNNFKVAVKAALRPRAKSVASAAEKVMLRAEERSSVKLVMYAAVTAEVRKAETLAAGTAMMVAAGGQLGQQG